MSVTWYKTGNGRLGFETLGTGESSTVQADIGECWKVINIFHSGGITLHYLDTDGTDCEFYTSEEEKGSEEFGNLQIQDENNAWIVIDNDEATDNVIVIDAVVW